MSTEGGQNRITVSEDKLDAKLAKLELSLVDRITKALDIKADQAYVEQLHARIHSIEATTQATAWMGEALKDVEQRTRKLERFRYAIPSAAAISVIAAVSAAVAAFLHL